ncbi:GCN5-related N-acetyltransferase [Rhodospirillaceae bacterium LM-1]|nr:GCN5-related N-acetyltransferase [Rhodospirillaceae bacterium LM-1]
MLPERDKMIFNAAENDLQGMTDLLLSLFDQEADFSPDRSKQERGLSLILSNPQVGQLFVARDETGAVTGMVSLLFTVSTAMGQPVCWLEDMVVRADQRGRGLGSKLLAHAVAYARAQGFGRITLLTDRLNEPAQRFYARHGFNLSEMTPMRLIT